MTRTLEQPLVVDANVVLSALIADSASRELLVTVEPTLLTPEVIHDELEAHRDTVAEKSELSPKRVEQFLDLLFQYIEIVPVASFADSIDAAEAAIADTDSDDVLYLACAVARNAAVWSDDSDFRDQSLVPVVTTTEVAKRFG